MVPVNQFVFTLTYFSLVVQGMDFITEDENRNKISFKAPELSEEEERSPFFTSDMICDGCLAVAHQVDLALKHGHKNYNSMDYRLKESDLLDLLEKVCDSKKFDEYGITRNEDGTNRLKGPGLLEGAGLAHMGGRTPGRLSELCRLTMDLDEMKIYQAWIENGRDAKALRPLMCEGPEYCQNEKPAVPKKDEM